MAKSVAVKTDKMAEVLKGLAMLSDQRVMVGIPQDKNQRQEGSPISNAALGYIHENGAPEVNIPARPWLRPSVKGAEKEIVLPGLKRAGELAMDGKPEGVMRVYHAMGIKVVSAVKAYITAGIAPSLKQSTIDGRKQRSSGSKYRRKASSITDVTPLVDTGQLRNSISYVVRSSKESE